MNWVEIAQSIASIIFVADVDKQRCFCPSKLEWEAGIVSMALTWVVLVWVKTMHHDNSIISEGIVSMALTWVVVLVWVKTMHLIRICYHF